MATKLSRTERGKARGWTLLYGHEARVYDAKALRRRARKFAKEDSNV